MQLKVAKNQLKSIDKHCFCAILKVQNERSVHMRKFRRAIWGIVLIVAAIIIALNSFDIIDFDVFFDGWWTLFIIIPCFVGIFEKGNRLGNLIGLAFGVCLLLSAQDVIEFAIFWKLLIPISIAYVGFKMIFSSFIKAKKKKIHYHINNDSREMQRSVAVFCGTEVDFSNTVFKGANLVTCFGGIDCDLRNAIIEKDCNIKVVVLFGGIEIQVPDNVNVVSNIPCVFGGTDVMKNNPGAEHTIYIDGFCAFGGVDVK